MIKINSLDLINKDFFEADIMTADGRVLLKKGEKVNPQVLLKLYFKDIYVEKPLTEAKPQIEQKVSNEEEMLMNQLAKINPTPEPDYGVDLEVETKESKEKLEFNEDEANRVAELSVKIAQKLNWTKDTIDELKQAAYYHNIGRTNLTKGDLNKKDFRKKQAIEGYDILLNEKKMSIKIAETAKFYIHKYDTSNQKLGDEIPYAQIVGIANYYDGLLTVKKMSKDEALDKMLQLGGNRFNIFVLHKFIKMMREENE